MSIEIFNKDHPEYIVFPNPQTADESGLLGSGGDLQANTLISAYYQGIFPWYSHGQPILWWSPNPRMVIHCDQFHVSRSLRKRLKAQQYEIRCNTDFRAVMQHCASSRWRRDIANNTNDLNQTWITPAMLEAYCKLNDLGFAHSIECWQSGELVGGLYGVSLGKLFFGESMFSKASDASKVALFYLCEFLKPYGSPWIDCQVESEHLKTLGAQTIPRSKYIADIKLHQNQGLAQKLPWNNFASYCSSIIL